MRELLIEIEDTAWERMERVAEQLDCSVEEFASRGCNNHFPDLHRLQMKDCVLRSIATNAGCNQYKFLSFCVV